MLKQSTEKLRSLPFHFVFFSVVSVNRVPRSRYIETGGRIFRIVVPFHRLLGCTRERKRLRGCVMFICQNPKHSCSLLQLLLLARSSLIRHNLSTTPISTRLVLYERRSNRLRGRLRRCPHPVHSERTNIRVNVIRPYILPDRAGALVL